MNDHSKTILGAQIIIQTSMDWYRIYFARNLKNNTFIVHNLIINYIWNYKNINQESD